MKHAGLIVGLGNPGRKYARQRHNVGFMAVDNLRREAFQERASSIAAVSSGRLPAALWSWQPENGLPPWLLAEPTTYMNRSGQAVIAVCKRFGLTPAQLLVVHDELDLPLGRVRFKQGGGLAGHNGLKSIAESLGTRGFDRLRLGIGRPGPGHPVDGYVLTSFPPEERDSLESMLDLAVKGLRRYILDGMESAMNEVHPK